MAQTKVVKKNAVKANNFGITYSLPKTQLIVDAEVTKVTCKAGPYYKYAEKYLGVKDAITEDKVYYELGKLSLINKGIPDPDNTYIVEFKSGTVAPYAYLTEEGLLCSINADYTPDESELETIKKNGQGPVKVTDASVFSEELLMAGSTARQAEVAAKQIYRIRESRLNILTGDADNLPPDGEAMKLVIQQLEEQEKALSNLFTGILTKETSHYEVSITPYDNLDKEVLFRFSRMTDHQGCTKMNARHLSTDAFQQGICFFFRYITTHHFQHRIADMLQGYIQIFADIITLTHHPQQVIRKMGRITVMQTDPFYTRNIGNTLDQLRQRIPFI